MLPKYSPNSLVVETKKLVPFLVWYLKNVTKLCIVIAEIKIKKIHQIVSTTFLSLNQAFFNSLQQLLKTIAPNKVIFTYFEINNVPGPFSVWRSGLLSRNDQISVWGGQPFLYKNNHIIKLRQKQLQLCANHLLLTSGFITFKSIDQFTLQANYLIFTSVKHWN